MIDKQLTVFCISFMYTTQHYLGITVTLCSHGIVHQQILFTLDEFKCEGLALTTCLAKLNLVHTSDFDADKIHIKYS